MDLNKKTKKEIIDLYEARLAMMKKALLLIKRDIKDGCEMDIPDDTYNAIFEALKDESGELMLSRMEILEHDRDRLRNDFVKLITKRVK